MPMWFLLLLTISISRRVAFSRRVEPRVSDVLDRDANGTVQDHLLNRSQHGEPFKVMQYNILAKALGNNQEPWFLFGADVTTRERERVKKTFDERNRSGNFKNQGFEKYARSLSKEKRKKITNRSNEVFAWDGTGDRGNRLAKEIAESLSDIVILEEVDALMDSDSGKQDGLHSMINMHAMSQLQSQQSSIPLSRGISATRNREYLLKGPVFDAFLAVREKRPDGAAILWNNHRFSLLGRDRYIFEQGDRIFCMTLLEDTWTKLKVLVIATHLERNPEQQNKERTREGQIREIIRALGSIDASRYDAVVVAGDMNSDTLATWRAAVELFRSHTEIPPLVDAFSENPSGRKVCTSRTEERTVLIDYIFFSPHSLRPVNHKWGPERCPEHAIPDESHPSDHIALMVQFEWTVLDPDSQASSSHVAEGEAAMAWRRFQGQASFDSIVSERLLPDSILKDAASNSTFEVPALQRNDANADLGEARLAASGIRRADAAESLDEVQ